MKNSVLLFIITVFGFLISSSLWAQAPEQFNYQAVLRDNENILSEQMVNVRFTLHQGSPNGAIVYQETQNATTDQYGHLNASVGNGTPINGVFSNIDWGNGSKYLQIEVDHGSGFQDMGAQRLLSVPYALYAGNSSNGGNNPNGEAGGDLTGTYPNPQIAEEAVTSSKIASQEVKTTNLEDGAVTAAKINQMNATDGQVLQWDGTTWTPITLSGGGTGDDWGTQVAETTDRLTGEGTTTNPLDIAQQGAVDGQVLKWNGTTWEPADDEVSSGSGGSGDDWGSQVVEADATLDGEGTTANPLGVADDAITTDKLANNAVTGEKINDMGATADQFLKWNGTAWVPANVSGGTGDNWGSQIAETDATLDGDGTNTNPLGLADAAVTNEKIDQMNADDGQVLKWNGTNWEPADDETGSGGGSGDDWGTQVAQTSDRLSGDGTTGNPLDIATQGATTGQVLKFDGTNWVPGTDDGGSSGTTYTAGDGIDISGADEITAVLGTDIETNELQDEAVTGEKINQMNADDGQVLKWNGTTWEPADDEVGSGGGGSGDDWGAQTVETDITLTGDGTAGSELGLAQNGATDGQILSWDDSNNNWTPMDLTTDGDAFFEADTDQIIYADTDNFEKDFLVNTNQIDRIGSGDLYKMMFLPSKNGAFRAGRVFSLDWNENNIGLVSTAFGTKTEASGDYSAAFGISTEATGYNSTALGYATEASGDYSTAMGRIAKAPSYAETAIGSNNTEYTPVSTTDFENADRQFTVGIGSDNSNKADGFMVMKSGLVTAPEMTTTMIDNNQDALVTKEYLDANGSSGDAFFEADADKIRYSETSDYGKNFLINTSNVHQGVGTDYKMMFLPSKNGAFRAGAISNNFWNLSNVGSSSVAFGSNTTASDYSSTALGTFTKASGSASTAMGSSTEASSESSTAMGSNTEASGKNSTAMGSSTEASGENSTAMGRITEASGKNSTAMGFLTEASGKNSTAMGYKSEAKGENSTAIGNYVTTKGKGTLYLADASRSESERDTRNFDNRFYARFDGGYYLWTHGTADIGIRMLHGANSWSTVSDSTKKENVKLANGTYFLESIKKMKIGSWNYIGQDPEKYRHWGPMAQDFHKYFGHDGVGTIGTDTTIATADIDGVMMIAIQQLAHENDSLQTKKQNLDDEILALKQELSNQKRAMQKQKQALEAKIDNYAEEKQVLEAKVEHFDQVNGEMEERLSKLEGLLLPAPEKKYSKR